MRQTAEMSKDSYPRECDIVKHDSYVDDILSSSNTETEVIDITKGIDFVLKKGDFVIKHWTTNANLSNISEKERRHIISFKEEQVLGVWWNLQSDNLFLKAKIDFTKPRHD